MWLKRIFKNKKPDHVLLKTAPKNQKFSVRFVQNGIEEGWLKLRDGSIQIQGFWDRKNDLGVVNRVPAPSYQVIKYPGIYCCFCEEMLPDGGIVAQSHVEDKHHGLDSPDAMNKSGYRFKNFYECERED